MFFCCPSPAQPEEDFVTSNVQDARVEASLDVLAPNEGVFELPPSPMAKALHQIIAQYPYIDLESHTLHLLVVECRNAIRADQLDTAQELLRRIEQQNEQEAETLGAAFSLFLSPGQDDLDTSQIGVMLGYLGFPADSKSVNDVLASVDEDNDGRMNLAEFMMYVGYMGGSFKLFEVRRKSLEGSFAVGSEELEHEQIRLDLLKAGITDASQAYWKLVVPPSEFAEASRLVMCQKEALGHIRMLAKSNHDAALPRLLKRVARLGFKEQDLWMTLAWIREMAPIILHINLDKLLEFMEKDTHYRNQFETATSGGLLKPAVRHKWEHDLFGGYYDKATPFERCKYGVLNVMNDYRGVVKCMQYGDSYLVLKDCRLRCTFSPEDSANLKADRLAVLDYYGHVLYEYSDAELRETIKVGNSSSAALLGDSGKVGAMKYKETQVHGEVCLDKHVVRLVAAGRHKKKEKDRDRIQHVCKLHGWAFSWMDEEQKRMAEEEKHKLGAEAWRERLKVLTDKRPAQPVAAGFCRAGCGRPVQPGQTRKGNPYTTCCRGCIMGFGHDMRCGNADPDAMGEGKCKNGCGRDVSSATRPSGRPFDTCCRSCVRGHHDLWCGTDAGVMDTNVVAPLPGMCQKGCGRKVAEPKAGRQFTTCCRGCATGKPHSRGCSP